MRRVAIVGCSGGGKSTLARALGERLGLAVVHMDTLYWRPGWRGVDDAAMREAVDAAADQDAWIIEGDFIYASRRRFGRADTIIWVDLPRIACLFRAVRRMATHRGQERADLAEGCPEKFDWSFYASIWNWGRVVRPRLTAAIDEFGSGARRVVLRSDKEAAAFLAKFPAAPGAATKPLPRTVVAATAYDMCPHRTS